MSWKKYPMDYKIIIQARMGSSRLPGKVLIELAPGRTALECLIDRLTICIPKENIIIATTTAENDKAILDLSARLNIKAFAGSEQNVLQRYYGAAQECNAKNIVRITSDCPLMDSALLVDMLKDFASNECDYLSNTIERTYPRGLDIEILTFKALERAYLEAKSQPELEHVTPYIHQHPKLFKLKHYQQQQDLSFHRWTLDTEEDLELITKIYQELYPRDKNFTTSDILKLFSQNADLMNINAHIEQKKI
jgi:spore coat polysaccharide biosynthesis protein SpsF